MNFVKRLLAPHLSLRGIDIHAPMVMTSRDLRIGRQSKGGGGSFSHWSRDLVNLWNQHCGHGAHITTFLDLYALPQGFPSGSKPVPGHDFRQRAEQLELGWAEWAVANGIERFTPYLALHEFETMAFARVEALGTLFIEEATAIQKLEAEVAAFDDIEEINSTPQGAPSKRIEARIPAYRHYKRSDQSGIVNVLEVIDLPEIREKCLHVNEWLTKLESLSPH